MAVELDHVFIRVTRGAPEAECLRQAGFVDVGRVYSHPHQGTACIAFPFANSYLELLWVEDEAIAARAFGALAFAARPCRFGIGLRRCGDGTVPFLTRLFDPDPKIDIVDSSTDLTAPITFVVPGEYAWRGASGPRVDATELRGDTMELVLSGCGVDEQLDLRPILPLVIVRHP